LSLLQRPNKGRVPKSDRSLVLIDGFGCDPIDSNRMLVEKADHEGPQSNNYPVRAASRANGLCTPTTNRFEHRETDAGPRERVASNPCGALAGDAGPTKSRLTREVQSCGPTHRAPDPGGVGGAGVGILRRPGVPESGTDG